ncbi:MAG: amidohydrolase family protein [Rhodobacteraceae bacterium]|nr:amidohydrolase family protein [Paracoccaceae bacterium]
MIIDAHQHFWKLDRGDYGWLNPKLGQIFRDFLPEDIKPFLSRHKISGTILVQAAPTVAETEFLLKFAEKIPFIKGVVGWVDFESPNSAEEIFRLAEHSSLVGLRPMIQDIDDVDWMLNDRLKPAFRALIAADLTFDALTLPQHLVNLLQLLTEHNEMRVVIDHGSKPQIKCKQFSDWAMNMKILASETNAFCKLSGLVTEAGAGWTIDDLRPYVNHLLDVFGAGRLIWGSDWPVCTLAASYDNWVEVTHKLLENLTDKDRQAILGDNARVAYNLVT